VETAVEVVVDNGPQCALYAFVAAPVTALDYREDRVPEVYRPYIELKNRSSFVEANPIDGEDGVG
jgi:hypothetical protein